VRQPLADVIVSVTTNKEQESLERLKPQILEELNVKDLKFIDNVASLENESYVISSESGYLVAVSTELSSELKAEGLARELVHRLQTMRRQAGFDIADHITTYYQSDTYTKQVIETFTSYIKRETLSRALVDKIPGESVFAESYKLAGHDILLAVTKLATGLPSDSKP
jgi:isoleucyl-tRNA synthetase